jgi:hypothetical protein
MAVYPGDDEGTPIPFVKVYGELVVAPAPTVWVGDDVFLYVELVNMGTAPSRDGDTLTGSLVFGHAVFHQESVNFPPIEPNGGMWKHAFKFDGRFLMAPGEWELSAMITNVGTIGEVQDDQRVQFTVSAKE